MAEPEPERRAPVLVVGTQYVPPSKRKPLAEEPKKEETKIKLKKREDPVGAVDETAQDEEIFVEEHLVLRLPSDLPAARQLYEMVSERKDLSSFLAVQMGEGRRGHVLLDGAELPCRLVDLPCIIEALKTFDSKQFYKVGDVSQMLLVDKDAAASSVHAGIPDTAWPDGIAPPLRRTRSRRFRKRLVGTDAADIEVAVRALLEADANAEEISYHLFHPDEASQAKDFTASQVIDDLGDTDLDELLGIRSSPLDDSDNNAADASEPAVDAQQSEAADEQSAASSEYETDDSMDDGNLLEEELASLHQREIDLRAKIAAATNAVLKCRLEDELPKLLSTIQFKQKQLDGKDFESSSE